jgi:hypothetical protein
MKTDCHFLLVIIIIEKAVKDCWPVVLKVTTRDSSQSKLHTSHHNSC